MSETKIIYTCASVREGGPLGAATRVDLRSNPAMEGEFIGIGDEPVPAEIILLDESDIQTIRRGGAGYEPGDCGETLVLSGDALQELGIGTTLRVGDAQLEITRIGLLRGAVVNAPPGAAAHILTDGVVKPGERVTILSKVPRGVPQAAVLTVSDRCAEGRMRDTSGPAVAAELTRALGARIAATAVVPDEESRIIEALRDFVTRGIDLLVTIGGTGCGARDVTPEATRSVIAREVPGLAEAMRAASMKSTRHALLQRGVCGIRNTTLIVNLPGSRKAALENLTAILDVLPHAIGLLRGEVRHRESDAERTREKA